jgi:hypothetical protein
MSRTQQLGWMAWSGIRRVEARRRVSRGSRRLADQNLRDNEKKARSRCPPYTSKIIKAGALLVDTKTLLSHWDVRASIRENLDRLHRENVFGKASRSRVKNILAIFRQRYLREDSVARALVTLVNRRFPASSLDRLFYFHSARADYLLHDMVTEVLLPLKVRGIMDIEVPQVEGSIVRWVREGKTTRSWGENTIRRVTQGLLSTLRDFGVLAGAVNKRLAPAYLSIEAFAYITFYLKQRQPSGAKLIESLRLFTNRQSPSESVKKIPTGACVVRVRNRCSLRRITSSVCLRSVISRMKALNRDARL